MAASRCPMCHLVNESTDWRCRRCGYEFGQPVETTRELLRDQLRGSRIAFWCLLVVLIAAFAGPVYMAAVGSGVVIMPGIVLVIYLVRTMLRASTKVSISRASLASLARQYAELPKATVVSHTEPRA